MRHIHLRRSLLLGALGAGAACAGPTAAAEAIVYWWRSVSDGQGGWTSDTIRALVAPLR